MKKEQEKDLKELVGEMEDGVRWCINNVMENFIYGGELQSYLWDSFPDEYKKLLGEICLMNEDGEEDTFNEIFDTIQDSLYTPVEFDTEIDELLKRLV